MNNHKSLFPVISWKEIQGNKFIKAIDPAMLMDGGLPYIMKARTIGSGKYGSEPVTVIFDREYVESWIRTKLIRPLSNYGVDYVSNLLAEAWSKSNYPTESLLGKSLVKSLTNYEK